MTEVRAALNLLLRLLRAQGIAAIPATSEIERELAYFDAKTVEVWGLSRGTRDHRCRIIRRFLHARFGDKPIVLASIGASDVRSFVLGRKLITGFTDLRKNDSGLSNNGSLADASSVRSDRLRMVNYAAFAAE